MLHTVCFLGTLIDVLYMHGTDSGSVESHSSRLILNMSPITCDRFCIDNVLYVIQNNIRIEEFT